jgi:5-methylcytosine-specific restriction enzyme A
MPFLAKPGRPTAVATAREVSDARRGSAHERGYTRGWQKAAAAFKLRFPLCGMRPNGAAPVMSRCFERGLHTLAYQVDHVVPHRGDLRLFWDAQGNWQSLCRACGARKSRAGL